MSHTELRHPQLHLLPNDTLTILCEISISGDNFVTCGTTKSVPFVKNISCFDLVSRTVLLSLCSLSHVEVREVYWFFFSSFVCYC